MNKLVIPTILVGTVLIAGIFAFMPVHPATAVHLFIIEAIEDLIGSAKVITVQQDIHAFGFDTDIIVLLDTTDQGDIAQFHFAATLPTEEDDDGCDEGDDPFSGIVLLAGVAGGDLTDVSSGTNAGLDPARTVDFDGDPDDEEAMCIFHATIAAGDVTGGVITDIALALIGLPDSLPEGSYITITATLEN